MTKEEKLQKKVQLLQDTVTQQENTIRYYQESNTDFDIQRIQAEAKVEALEWVIECMLNSGG